MPEFAARLAATYSIVARDPESGDLGVGVQSHYFAVGAVVPWAEAGVGAVATQSFVEPGYGPRMLARLRRGEAPEQALAALGTVDDGSALRQVAVVDARGRAAAHTGTLCIPVAGGELGPDFAAQGNMLRAEAVWRALGPAFAKAEEPLAERLLAALDAAEAAGGDARGRQSAALLVVSGERSDEPWQGRSVDLRVDDHPQPLDELRRLLRIRRAAERFEVARERLGRGDLAGALADVEAARALQPENVEFLFWTGVALANHGRRDEARALLREACAAEPGWRVLASGLVARGLLPDDPGLLA